MKSGRKKKRRSENLVARSDAQWQRLTELSIKLIEDEPLNRGERLWLHELLKTILAGKDVLPRFFDTVKHRPPDDDRQRWIALHYRVLRAQGEKSDPAAEIVSQAWNLADTRSVKRIEQHQRSICDDILARSDHAALLAVLNWHRGTDK